MQSSEVPDSETFTYMNFARMGWSGGPFLARLPVRAPTAPGPAHEPRGTPRHGHNLSTPVGGSTATL